MRSKLVLVVLALGVCAFSAHAAELAKAENFRTATSTGGSWELFYQGDSPAVVLFAFDSEDAASREAATALESLRAAQPESGVVIAGINVRKEQSRVLVQATAESLGLGYPVLMDPTQRIAHALGLAKAGEALLIAPGQEWQVLYKGAVGTPGAGAAGGLSLALDAHLEGEPVAAPALEVTGAAIAYAEPAVSYAKDIAPILASKCVTCHHDGGLGPFPMSNYKKVQGWAEMIRETVRTKRMPPWHADPEMGDFMHSRALTADEETKLLAWIEAGAPQGEGEDPLPALQTQPTEWQLGEPDHVVQLPAPEVLPATGIVDYRYIPVEANIDEDKWIRAIEVRTNNRPVLHHALIFVTYPKEYRHVQPRSHSGLNGYFAAYLPGQQIDTLPPDKGVFLPKGATFTFQMHYSVTGKPETEQCEMGLYFHDATPEKAVMIEAAHENDFLVPPNARDHEVVADYTFDHDAEILGLSPHMHFRGSRFKFAANLPDGTEMDLLNVPFYEFDWQPMYYFKEPIKVPAETEIVCVGAFDNSKFNKKNPNPGQLVAFGEQSFEEMFIGYVSYAIPRESANLVAQEVDPADYIGMGEKITQENIIGMQFRVERRLVMEFKPDGLVESVDGAVKGKYTFVSPSRIMVRSIFGEFEFTIIGDEIFMMGRPLKRMA